MEKGSGGGGRTTDAKAQSKNGLGVAWGGYAKGGCCDIDGTVRGGAAMGADAKGQHGAAGSAFGGPAYNPDGDAVGGSATGGDFEVE